MTDPPKNSPGRAGATAFHATRAWSRSPFAPIWVACALLFAVSPLVSGGALSSSSVLSMLPFAAVLAIASIGQTLVVQQRGFDLSVPGTISLAAVIVTKYPHGDNGKIAVAVLLVLAAAVATGLVNGFAISWFGISPIVATLGINAVLLGFVLTVSGGSPANAAGRLSGFALNRTIGIPNTALVAIGFTALAWFVSRKTTAGRRFEAAGANPRAAYAVGIAVQRNLIATYVAASVCYAAAGVLLAAYLQTPSIFSGTTYLFATVAAVVLAGTPLSGGVGSVVATAVAALFLTQLEYLVLSASSETAIQYLIQGAAIGIGMAFRNVPWRSLVEWARTILAPHRAPSASQVGG